MAAILTAQINACAVSPIADKEDRVYHCVATDRPIAPPHTWAKKTPLELFEYGELRIESRPTISGMRYCSPLQVPKTAYIRYRVDDHVIEKHFDLSSLTPRRVYGKDVEFFVAEDIVEVRLVTLVKDNLSLKEVIVRH